MNQFEQVCGFSHMGTLDRLNFQMSLFYIHCNFSAETLCQVEPVCNRSGGNPQSANKLNLKPKIHVGSHMDAFDPEQDAGIHDC